MTDKKIIAIIAVIFLCGIVAGISIFTVAPAQNMDKEIRHIFTEQAPKPIGPYSQAVMYDGFVFTSGQIGIDPVTGNLSATTAGQTTQAMENLRAVLASDGLAFSDVVQARIYLTDLGNWDTVNAIYAGYFEYDAPARAVIGVSTLPKGADIEIEMIARRS